LISFCVIVSVLFSVMSYTPPLGHFNLAGIGHYYFALTICEIDLINFD
jgi:hypothetical protein